MATQTFTKEERQTYIGGSDIAAVMGLSRYKTPLRLWAEKTGKIEPVDLSDNEAVEMGKELEEFIAQKFSRKTGKAVRRAPKTYFHKDYPYMAAHVDRLITGADEILECKNASEYKMEEWGNEENPKIPQEYILQVMWYIGIRGWKVGYIAVLVGGNKFRYRRIEFDQELFDSMVESAKDFWASVQSDIMPPVSPSDSETLLLLYPHHSEDILEMQDIEERVAYLQEIKMHISEQEKEKEEIETEIKSLINTNMGVMTQKYKVTWKEQSSTRLDTQAIKNDGLYEKYSQTSSFRVLRITKNKEVA